MSTHSEPENGPKFKDGIITHHEIHLSFVDRVRVLFGQSIRLYSETQTQNEIGHTSKTETRMHVDRVFKRRHEPAWYAAPLELPAPPIERQGKE